MIELVIVASLILLNGLFALSELAVVSARRARLKALAVSGHHGASSALALAADPGRYLSAVQIGITLIGILNGAYSGESFGGEAVKLLKDLGLPGAVAGPLGFGSIVIIITYFSVTAGELVPKHLALRDPERIACLVAPAMTTFARIANPAVTLLDATTRIILRLIGHSHEPPRGVTDDEIRALITEAETAGVIKAEERQMITGVMLFADRTVTGLMTPRNDVDWIDATASGATIMERINSTRHSRLPVGEGSEDRLMGVVHTQELLAAALGGGLLDIRPYVRKSPMVPKTAGALEVLGILRGADVPMALIHDENDHFEGIVTPADILEAIAGAFKSDLGSDAPYATERDDGSWLLSGGMPADAMASRLGIELPEPRDYQTVAGFLLARLQRIPEIGEWIETNGWYFEVIALDGQRIRKVLARRHITPHRRAL